MPPPSCKPGDKRKQCVGFLPDPKSQFRPYEGAKYRYKGSQCTMLCDDPESNICKSCIIKERKTMNGDPKILFPGRVGGPLHPKSHVEGSEWNLEERRKNAAKGSRRANANASGRAKAKPKAKAKSKKAKTPSSSSSSSSNSSSSSKRKRKTVRRRSGSPRIYVPASAAPALEAIRSKPASPAPAPAPAPEAIRSKPASPAPAPAPAVFGPRSFSPPARGARPNAYREWDVATPLGSSEKNSGNVDVLRRIQEGLNEDPRLAPKLD